MEWAYTCAWNVERDKGAVASPDEAMVTIGIKRARDSALRADSNTVSALGEAMGSAWGVERNDGCLPLVSFAERTNPDGIRLIANTSKSALPPPYLVMMVCLFCCCFS